MMIKKLQIADIPGLIENAHRMFAGIKFLKHIERM